MVVGEMTKVLEVSHCWVARIIMGMTEQHTTGREWECPSVTEALETFAFCTNKEYIQRRQDTVASQVDFQPIYKMCGGEYWILGTNKFMLWWEQDMGWEVD